MLLHMLRSLAVLAVVASVTAYDVIPRDNDDIPRDDDAMPRDDDDIPRDNDVTPRDDDVMPREVFPGIGEYFYVNKLLNWTESVVFCRDNNAHLAVVDSAAEFEALTEMLVTHNASIETLIHIGFSDSWVEGYYNDILGTPVDSPCKGFSNWDPGYPLGGTAYNCGGLSFTGFRDFRCMDRQYFICEMNPIPNNLPYCLRDYTLIPGFGYYKRHGGWSWPHGDEICRQEGTHLLIINSEQEIQALRNVGFINQTGTYNVGVHRYYGGNDRFVTSLGGTLEQTGYSTWVDGHPLGNFITSPYVVYWETGGENGLIANSVGVTICEQEFF